MKFEDTNGELYDQINTTTKCQSLCIRNVPSALCANEQIVREIFTKFGQINSIRIHHDRIDMASNGFMFLEYNSSESCQNALHAIETGRIQVPMLEELSFTSLQMKACIAISRGPIASSFIIDEDISDLLTGQRHADLLNPFSSQLSMEEKNDELVLENLSQTSFLKPRKTKTLTSSSMQSKGKKKRKREF